MPLEEELVALAGLAGQGVVAAAMTDAWGSAKRGFARLLGRGDPAGEERAAVRLEETRQQLIAVPVGELEQARGRAAAAWQTRLEDLLDEDPGAAGDLRALVEEVRSRLPAGTVTASGHGLAVGGDVTITSSGSGVAAGVVHGNVAPPDPPAPGPAAL
jgi:hypothetical protein